MGYFANTHVLVPCEYSVFGKVLDSNAFDHAGPSQLRLRRAGKVNDKTALYKLKPPAIIQQHAGYYTIENGCQKSGAWHIGPCGDQIRIQRIKTKGVAHCKYTDLITTGYAERNAYCEQQTFLFETDYWAKYAVQLLPQILQWTTRFDRTHTFDTPRFVVQDLETNLVSNCLRSNIVEQTQEMTAAANALMSNDNWATGSCEDPDQAMQFLVGALAVMDKHLRKTSSLAFGYLQPLPSCDLQIFIDRDMTTMNMNVAMSAQRRSEIRHHLAKSSNASVENMIRDLALVGLIPNEASLMDYSNALKDEETFLNALEITDLLLSATFNKSLERVVYEHAVKLLKHGLSDFPFLSHGFWNRIASTHIMPLLVGGIFDGRPTKLQEQLDMALTFARLANQSEPGESLYDRTMRAPNDWQATIWESRCSGQRHQERFSEYFRNLTSNQFVQSKLDYLIDEISDASTSKLKTLLEQTNEPQNNVVPFAINANV